jgi:RND family efflux transporter MFP subunit
MIFPNIHKTVITAALAIAALPSTAIAADCIVNAHSIAKLGASEKGIIAAIQVDRSDHVKAGQIVAELDASQEEKRLALAELRATNTTAIDTARKKAETAEQRVKRLTRLSERNFSSQAELDEAILEAETARLEEQEAILDKEIASLEVDTVKAAIERKKIRAPFDGVVMAKMVSRGELYNEQNPILTLARIDPLYVETYLPLEDLAKVEIGATAPITLETGERVEGTITVRDAVLDAATGTFGVRLEVPNPDGAILAGQRCEVVF